MLEFPDHARELRKGEEDAVDALLRAAFETGTEADLVRALRKSGQIAGETVLPMGDRIVGYYALSKMIAPKKWLCLAPVAVAPDVQGRRFGTRMMGMVSEWARLSKSTIVVLGKVTFYERAGFSGERAQNLTTPYPLSHTMLAGEGDAKPSETLIYPKAFAALD
jgi:putative acetyltransferase